MRTPYIIPGAVSGRELDDLATLEKLVADLAIYARGDGPSAAELARAPMLTDWIAVRDTTNVRLLGQVTGHPRIGPGPGMSSQVYAVDRERRWARTYSRLWRLGSEQDR